MRVSSHTESTRLPARSLAFPPLQQRTELTSRECRLPKTYGSGMQEIGERRARGTKPAPVQSKQAVDDDKRRTVCPYRRRRGGGQKTERSVSASPMRPTPRRKVGETDTTSTRLLLDGGLDQRLQHMPRVRNRKHDPPLLNGLGEKRERRGEARYDRSASRHGAVGPKCTPICKVHLPGGGGPHEGMYTYIYFYLYYLLYAAAQASIIYSQHPRRQIYS